VRTIAARFPAQADWGVKSFQVVPFVLSTPFAGFDAWKIPFSGELDLDLPPQRYTHEYHPTADPRHNHDLAVAALTSWFGAGETGASSNVYERWWRVGFFKIRVMTWPRELNPGGRNEFEGRNPYLWISANVTIEPDFPFVERTEDASAPMEVLLEHPLLGLESRVYARRNIVDGAADLRRAGIVGDAFVVRGSETSLRVPLGEIRAVEHTRVTPDRYSGSSKLAFETVFLGRHEVHVTIANGAQTDSLDAVAKPVARRLSKPLRVEEYADEG
jgi:hypothetical protein